MVSNLGTNGAAGGLILYAINKDLNTQRAIILENNVINLQLEKGNWEFVTIGWGGAGNISALTGELKCGRISKKLEKSDESLSFTFSSNNCNDNFFSPSLFRTAGTPQLTKPIRLINCSSIVNPVAGNNCDSSKGISQQISYKIRVLAHPVRPRGNLVGLFGNNPNSLETECISETSATSSVTTTNISLPYGSFGFFMPVAIDIYSDSSCSTNKQSVIFPKGIGDTPPLAGVNRQTSNTVNYGDFFLKLSGLHITSGDLNFGVVPTTQEKVTEYTLQNTLSTAITLSNITSSSSSAISPPPFSVLASSNTPCHSGAGFITLNASSSCKFKVKFIPPSGANGPVTGAININFSESGTGSTKSFPIGGFGLKVSFNTVPQSGSFAGLPSSKIRSVYMNSSGLKIVGTDGGLALKTLTSSNYTVRTTKNGLGSNVINKVYYLDSSSVGFIGTENGLSYWSGAGIPNTLTNKTTTDGLPSNFVKDVFATSLSGGSTLVLVATDFGFAYSTDGGTSFTTLTSSGNSWSLNVNAIHFDGTDIYFATTTGLYHSTVTISGSTVSFTTPAIQSYSFGSPASSTSTSGVSFIDVDADANGLVYALVSGSTSNAGLYKKGTTNFEQVFQQTGAFSSIAIDQTTNEIYIGDKESGVWLVTPSVLSGYTSSQILNNAKINELFYHSGGIELAKEDGLQNLIYSSLTLVLGIPKVTSGLRSNKLSSLGVLGSGANTKLLVGSDSGVAYSSNNGNSFSNFLSSTENVSSIFTTPTDVFVGTKGTGANLYHSSLSGISGSTFSGVLNSVGDINDLFVTNGLTPKVFAATSSSGIKFANLTSLSSYNALTTTNSLTSNHVRRIFIDGGNIYASYPSSISTQYAISSFDIPTNAWITNHYNQSGGEINRIYVHSNGNLYLATSTGGVLKKSPGATTHTSLTSGLGDLFVNDVFVTNIFGKEVIFAATKKGLSISSNGTTFSNFTTADGLPSNNVQKVFVDQNGVITVACGSEHGGGVASSK